MFNDKYLEWNQKRIKCIIDFYGHNFLYMKKVLDLGCGQADISGALYRLGADVTAVDARAEHLSTATKKFQGIKTIKADLERGWPFNGKKFDLVLDLALMCHLRDWEKHLSDVCSSTQHLILETAVCDSDDPEKCIILDENKGIYDNSINGVACRPSAAAIERVLTKSGMSFKRIDNSRLNSPPFIYDWKVKNNNDSSINNRRIWFCVKIENQLPQTSVLPDVAPQNFNLINNTFQSVHNKSHLPPLSKVVRNKTNAAVAYNPPKKDSIKTILPNIPMNQNLNEISNEVRLKSKLFSISPENSLARRPDLKVFYVPLGDQVGMYDAWKNVGVQLKTFDFYSTWINNGRNSHAVNQEFLKIVEEFRPNLIHMQLQITDIITLDTLRKAKSLCPEVIITNWSGDIRETPIQQLTQISKEITYSLISSTGQLDLYRRSGCNNIKYWQIGYDPKVHYPKHYNNFIYDVTFIGNNYGGSFPDGQMRASAVTKCLHTFHGRFGIFGTGWSGNTHPIDPQDANEIYNKSICALSISNFNNVSHYFSDRLLYCLASGRPTISWYFPGCESYFEEGKEIFYARSFEDVINLVNHCKQNPDLANEVGANGAKKVLSEHTYTSKVLELLDMLYPNKSES